jgi:hypothetical protein
VARIDAPVIVYKDAVETPSIKLIARPVTVPDVKVVVNPPVMPRLGPLTANRPVVKSGLENDIVCREYSPPPALMDALLNCKSHGACTSNARKSACAA